MGLCTNSFFATGPCCLVAFPAQAFTVRKHAAWSPHSPTRAPRLDRPPPNPSPCPFHVAPLLVSPSTRSPCVHARSSVLRQLFVFHNHRQGAALATGICHLSSTPRQPSTPSATETHDTLRTACGQESFSLRPRGKRQCRGMWCTWTRASSRYVEERCIQE